MCSLFCGLFLQIESADSIHTRSSFGALDNSFQINKVCFYSFKLRVYRHVSLLMFLIKKSYSLFVLRLRPHPLKVTTLLKLLILQCHYGNLRVTFIREITRAYDTSNTLTDKLRYMHIQVQKTITKQNRQIKLNHHSEYFRACGLFSRC